MIIPPYTTQVLSANYSRMYGISHIQPLVCVYCVGVTIYGQNMHAWPLQDDCIEMPTCQTTALEVLPVTE